MELFDLVEVILALLSFIRSADTMGAVIISGIYCILSFSAAASNLSFRGFVSILSQGNKYWRFDGDVLDPKYPRLISVGFDSIPDDSNAAFAVPAPSHRGKEKVYFFKGIHEEMSGVFQFFRSAFSPVSKNKVLYR